MNTTTRRGVPTLGLAAPAFATSIAAKIPRNCPLVAAASMQPE